MLVCLLSGAVLLFVYYPNEAYASVEGLKKLPFGLFFRRLHYFSAELFLIFLLIHIVVELARDSRVNLSKIGYISGVICLGATFVLMFSGYVLKGDLNALSAAQVAFSLILNTSVLDKFIAFFRDLEQFFWRFFVLHIVIFPAILLYFLKIHAKKIFTNYFLIALALTLIPLSFIAMPPDLNPLIITPEVSGPWFFLGGENLLIMGVSPVFTVLFLIMPFVLLGCLAFLKKGLVFVNLALLIWVGLYAYFCFI